jgi:hypothetical protein
LKDAIYFLLLLLLKLLIFLILLFLETTVTGVTTQIISAPGATEPKATLTSTPTTSLGTTIYAICCANNQFNKMIPYNVNIINTTIIVIRNNCWRNNGFVSNRERNDRCYKDT